MFERLARKNRWKKVNDLIRGSKNIDRMKSEIDLFVRLVAYFLSEPRSFSNCNSPYIFKADPFRWTLDIEVKEFKVIKGKIKCERRTETEVQNWFLIYEYDGIKNVTNKQLPVYYVREIYERLPVFEKKLSCLLYYWNDTLHPFIEASEIKF